jgi:NAD(P)-dependent dehydrogenase (short-subunit alcohol dehydrogenase family)
MNTKRCENQGAIVTGGCREIGRAIARASLFLASKEADNLNGTILNVDGGWLARRETFFSSVIFDLVVSQIILHHP